MDVFFIVQDEQVVFCQLYLLSVCNFVYLVVVLIQFGFELLCSFDFGICQVVNVFIGQLVNINQDID